ncbi:hypothetical protein phiST2_0163 [Vibrio phage phi-ST2]|nr:hypothetical protein phiST2_0163 [Vibrio phage phi-ST2]QBX06174.1 hypothetical protein Va3_221 [Vibrio phage Va3]QNJ54800.1 hypothetical protein vBValMR10Z_260 [Vibrio phage vB_ValM_R10Z]QNJ55187.1 hypothetical protein vBValMR11Z_261 [Vibrio phage vB_ValM_R11Z]URQ03500.1 hypothetical protein PVA23_123 [Vibrio phage PVA23]
MSKIAQVLLAIIGTILIPLAITSMSVATNYGGMQEALQVVQEQGKTAVAQNAMIMQEITDIKLTNATQAQQLISLEGSQALLVKKQDEVLVNYGRLESEVRALRNTSELGDKNLVNSVNSLKNSQTDILSKIEGTHSRYSKIETDLARVETLINIDSSDRFTGKDGDMLNTRIDNLETKVDEIDKRTKKVQ